MDTECEFDIKNIKSEFEIKEEELDVQISSEEVGVFVNRGLVSNEEVERELKLEEENYSSHFLQYDENYSEQLGLTEITPHPDQPEQESQNPWPHLKDYFAFISRDKKNTNILYFQCVLCQPKETTIKGHTSSFYNLKSHVKRSHRAHSVQFLERIKAFSCRGKHKSYRSSASSNDMSQSLQPPSKKICLPTNEKASDTLASCNDISQSYRSSASQSLQPPSKKICLPTNEKAPNTLAACKDVSQSVVDTKIMNLFVCNMLPLCVVESPTFVNLIKTLNPTKTAMSHSTLARRIEATNKHLEDYLIRLLKDVPWVATTADCWSVHSKSFLRITAHWLDSKTRKRQYAVLACSQLKEHPTVDVLTEAMLNTHCKFHLQDKVTRITTDNGRNFAKTFVQFGMETELLVYTPEPATDSEGVENTNLDVNSDTDAMDDVEYISVEAAFKNSSCLDHNLPVLMRCATNTFNMVVSEDANEAFNNGPFKMAYRNAISKAQALWYMQSRSTELDIILEELKVLVVPNHTSWNSIYDSVVVLNNVLKKKRETLHRLMVQLKLKTFTDSEVEFLKEYAQVMSIIAKALNEIQGELQVYLGSLLPIVETVITKLKDCKSKGLLYCNPLVNAILSGITKRFGPLLQNEECQLAAAFHPKFRLFALGKHNHSQQGSVKKVMEIAVETALRENIRDCNNTTINEDEEDNFFSNITKHQDRNQRSLRVKAHNLVKTWLEAGSEEVLTDEAFLCNKVFIDLFIKYNTAIPSSTAAEGLFSLDNDISRVKSSTLSDTNFEKMMFMKGNQHHIEEMEKELEIKQMIYMKQFLTPSPSSSRHGSTMSQSEEEGEEAPKPGTSSQGDSQERQPDINADHLPHIFQHLINFYGASKTKGKVKCKICFKEIRYSTISNYNIKCHYQNLHNNELPNLLAALSSGSKRRRHASGDCDSLPTHEVKKHQDSIEAIFKPRFEPMKALKLYYNYFIGNFVPYHLTDSVTLREFIQYLNPEFKVPSRRKMTRDIAQLGELAKIAISTLLENIIYVGTTASSWFSYHRSFLGMTVHWIDPVSLSREKAVLGIKVIVQQKASYLARVMMNLHQEFGLTNKVISTTTDNGQNYVAAFVMFARNGGEEEVAQVPVQEGEALPTTIHVGETLEVEGEEDENVHRELPKHRLCWAHILNLLATTDVSKVPGWNSGLRSPFTKTDGKAQALWNAQNRETVVANQIKEAVGKNLQTPGVTCWNSYYESCVELLEVLEDPNKKDQLNVVIHQQGLSPFYEEDKNLLAQYCKIMKPVANCLGNLRSEKNAYMGFLLPNLKLMRDQVVALQTDASIVEGQELIKYLLENPTNPQVAFKGRFEHLFADMDLLMATALHPHLKLPVVGYLNEELKETIRRRIISEVLMKVGPVDDNDGAAQEQEEVEDDPFQYMRMIDNLPQGPSHLEEDLKKAFENWNNLRVKRTTPLSLDLFPQQHREAWVDLFIKYNTPVPSAGVERLFSMDSDVHRLMKSSLNDDNFEKMVFVNGNMHLLKGKLLYQREEEDSNND